MSSRKFTPMQKCIMPEDPWAPLATLAAAYETPPATLRGELDAAGVEVRKVNGALWVPLADALKALR